MSTGIGESLRISFSNPDDNVTYHGVINLVQSSFHVPRGKQHIGSEFWSKESSIATEYNRTVNTTGTTEVGGEIDK